MLCVNYTLTPRSSLTNTQDMVSKGWAILLHIVLLHGRKVQEQSLLRPGCDQRQSGAELGPGLFASLMEPSQGDPAVLGYPWTPGLLSPPFFFPPTPGTWPESEQQS